MTRFLIRAALPAALLSLLLVACGGGKNEDTHDHEHAAGTDAANGPHAHDDGGDHAHDDKHAHDDDAQRSAPADGGQHGDADTTPHDDAHAKGGDHGHEHTDSTAPAAAEVSR